MQRLENNRKKLYDLENCFGFNENESELLLLEKSSIMNETNRPLEFQPNKPYRLALYVKPVDQKRVPKTKACHFLKNTVEKNTKNKKNDSVSSFRLVDKKDVKRSSSRINKKLNVMLFDENVKPDSVSKKIKKTPEKVKQENNVSVQIPSSRKNILKEVNTKPLTKSKQIKMRRSYERKFKEKDESENIPEQPSEEIIKEMEFKKLSRTKQKKTVKEEQEFEKWADNMNSAFDDVDKFELSITYD